MQLTKRPNVKSTANHVADEHERNRDFLGSDEINHLPQAAKQGLHGIRDHLPILTMYRQNLRVSEVTELKRADVNLVQSLLWNVVRL